MDRRVIEQAIEIGGGAVLLVLTLVAVVSVIRSPNHRIRDKALWLPLVLLVPLAGAVLWFFIGRAAPPDPPPRLPGVAGSNC